MKGKTGNEELTMVEKHKIIKKFSKEYNRTGKKGKGVIGEEIWGIKSSEIDKGNKSDSTEAFRYSETERRN